MRRVFVVALLLASLPVAAAVGGNGKDTHFGPYHSTSTDNGSCGVQWATDTFDREYKVHNNGDGTYRVREEFKRGSFVTNSAPSPGACETGNNHGTHIRSGVTGKMHGYLQGTVTSAAFDPNGCNGVGADCSTTQGFLEAAFGPAGPATFTCNLGYAGCKFKFTYDAHNQGLIYHHWTDSSTNPPGGEIFKGDIADL
jgi:hypothetical protein